MPTNDVLTTIGICLTLAVVICGTLAIGTFPASVALGIFCLIKLPTRYRVRVALLLLLATPLTLIGIVLGMTHPVWPDGYM